MIPQLLTAILLSFNPAVLPATPLPVVPQDDCSVYFASVQPLSGTIGTASGTGAEFSFAYAWSILGDRVLIEVNITSGSYQVVGVSVSAIANNLPVTLTSLSLTNPGFAFDDEFALGAPPYELVSLSVFLSRCLPETLETTTTTTSTTTVPLSNVPEVPATNVTTSTVPTTTAIGAGSGSLPATGSNSTDLALALAACALGAAMVALARRSRPA